MDKRPDLSNGSPHLSLFADNRERCRGLASTGSQESHYKIPWQLGTRVGATAHLGGVAESDAENMQLVSFVDGASERCEVRRTPDKDPHVLIVGTPAVSMFSSRLQVDLLAVLPYTCDGCVPEVFPLGTRPIKESSGSSGCLSQRMGRGFWATKGYSDV